MSSFAANEHFIYIVPKDILKKALVIFGSNDMELLPWRYQVKELAKTHEFVTEVCLSVAAAVKAFRKHKPDLLIFDCHGGYNSENKTSFLMLGDEQLTGPLLSSTISVLLWCFCAPATLHLPMALSIRLPMYFLRTIAYLSLQLTCQLLLIQQYFLSSVN